ncbi:MULTISPECIES: tol-pal system protein YbgF [unclassified Pseudomonas]|uniref:tol-pal system protein YbgF n=1 Tax=unclassified Pseudomonas TaxID=196821 RepID=UPI002AC8A8BB|nr:MULTISPECIES: tol-pal system protein YbgF [unclassified Pseudomonas]MEB0043353.1 tol-pal system protein YbgF [Pseudomonas sp. MH10]MEB0078085.1 tol-pal system protein YbgF [Pseudomonas sp. MH10out]MEB0089962.1 tol-pal system protein YbgF [Pseudomonas sp. CCI4.2]MEB0103201.1 tol-pal system protein YbgF [Pseudomonas sp. CCI3.2]MEB0122936.1 tol-pal system protein YbgF [Pseudomonas sp. CCI1.2]
MRTCRRALTVLTLALPLFAWGAVPVVDNNSGSGSSNSYPPAGYGTSGAYAGGGVATPASAQGQLFMQLQQMQDEIAKLRGTVEVQQNDIDRMKQEALERYQELDQRITAGAGAGGTPAAAATDNSQANGDVNAGGAPTAPAAQAPAASAEPGDPAKEKIYYDAAFDLIKAKDFDKASQAFTAFLRKYPNSQYAGNAQYWLGEVNLAKGDLQGAGQAFAKVSQLYPKHAKVPDSLYKLADVERRLGHTDKVKGILQQVVSQYPGTSAAQLAQRDLQRM